MTSFSTLPSAQVDATLIDSVIYNDEIITTLLALVNMTAGGVTLFTHGGSREIGWDVGDLKTRLGVSDLSNIWLRCDGRTIGKTSSGATARANVDMFTLYEYLWTTTNNTTYPIQNSAGVATSRGASPLADFDANKRFPLPDMRGRTMIGMDDPTGSLAANRITDGWADGVGNSGGSATHTLTSAEMPSHSHTGLFSASTNFHVLAGGGTLGGGAGGYLNDAIGNTGGGGAHANVQPSIAVNVFIYTGN